MLNPTPRKSLVDQQGRPYFLWDCDLTLDEFRERLRDEDDYVRSYFLGKLMRQAKPDDVFQFTTTDEIRALWDQIDPFLGDKRAFWHWLFSSWGLLDRDEE